MVFKIVFLVNCLSFGVVHRVDNAWRYGWEIKQKLKEITENIEGGNFNL